MRDYSELELIAQAAAGFSDVSLAPDVVLELIAENKRLRAGMRGDYDLDAWLDWTQEADGLRKDADRYQWLRGRDLETVRNGGIFAGMTPENVILNGLDLDQRIDFAMTRGEQS